MLAAVADKYDSLPNSERNLFKFQDIVISLL